MRYPHIWQTVIETPWAIHRAKLAEILGVLVRAERHGAPAALDLEEPARQERRTFHRSGSVALLPLSGILAPKMDLMMEFSGGTSTRRFAADFRAALADEEISSIVLDVDSPGGTVVGIPELASEILTARGKKPIVAVANAEMFSAAYWVASAADEIVVTPSGGVGSIGVVSVHEDLSKMLEAEGVDLTFIFAGEKKIDGNPYQPLSERAQADLQRHVDTFYSLFVNAVASGRRATTEAVRTGYGQGGIVLARDAVKAGMADRVGTLEDVVRSLNRPRRSKRRTAAALAMASKA